MHRFEKLNKLTINIFELNFCLDKNKWKHNTIPFEISKNESGSVVDLLIYTNHYALVRKINVFSGDHHKKFICRRCLESITSENMLMLRKPKCENNEICGVRTSSDSHLHWKGHFHKNPILI